MNSAAMPTAVPAGRTGTRLKAKVDVQDFGHERFGGPSPDQPNRRGHSPDPCRDLWCPPGLLVYDLGVAKV